MKKIKGMLAVSSLLLLTACGGKAEDTEIDSSDATEDIVEVEEIEPEEDADWEEAVGDIDFEEDELEDINWDEINLSKAQFKDFLNEMLDNPLEMDEEDGMDIEIEVLKTDFDGKTVEYTVTSVEEDNFMAEFAQVMYIYMIDGFTRQFYLHSDYSNGVKHPTIIFYDEAGAIITENNDFIEIEEENE